MRIRHYSEPLGGGFHLFKVSILNHDPCSSCPQVIWILAQTSPHFGSSQVGLDMVWTSATRPDTEVTWPGGQVIPENDDLWAAGEPTFGNGDGCTGINNGRLHDLNCVNTKKKHVVCAVAGCP